MMVNLTPCFSRNIFSFLLCFTLSSLIFTNNAFASLPQDLLNNKLTTAVDNRDIKHIKQLLDKGAEVSFSQIKSAISGKSDTKVLALLLDHLNTPYEPELFQQHLVMYPHKQSKDEFDRIFKLLLQHKPNIKLINELLLIAARKGSVKTYKRLQKHGATLVTIKQNKETGCMLNAAIKGGSLILVKEFLNAGFKPKGICLDSLTQAVKQNDLTLVKLLLTNGAAVDGDMNKTERPLSVAVENANLEIVRVLLENNASLYIKNTTSDNTATNTNSNIDIKKSIKDSLFYEAVQTGSIAILKELLKKSKYTPDYNDLLMTAVQSGHLEMLKFLHINKQANIKQKVIRPILLQAQQEPVIKLPTTTALHFAAENGHLDIVKYLLEQGLDPNAKEQDEYLKTADLTPLMLASLVGHYDVVSALIKHGADVDIQDQDGYTALYLAVLGHHKEILDLLVKNHAAYAFESTQKPSPNLSQDQPIHIAAQENDISLLSYLRNTHWPVSSDTEQASHSAKKVIFDIDAQNSQGKTALMIASENGFNAFARKLIEFDASLNLPDNKGKTALHYASVEGNYLLVKLLLEKGARADSADYDGNTSLHICDLNHEIFRLLLQYQYQINTTNALGETPLMRVIGLSDGFYTAELLKRGANIQIQDNQQRTLLHKIALLNKESSLTYKAEQIQTFTNATKTKTAQLALIASNDIAYRIEWLLQHDIDINAQDSDYNSALHYLYQNNLYKDNASSKLRTAISQRIIKAKANINATNLFGETPMFIAGNNFEWDAVKQLLNDGADPNIANYEGKTILFLAVQYNKIEIAELLQSKGADINLKDHSGRNPLFSLVDAGASTDILEFLIKAGIDLTIKDSKGRTIIQALAQSKNKNESLSRLDKILQQGLDINAVNNRLETALHNAVLTYSPKAVALLLKKGINLNAQDSDGATALHYAVNGHSFEMVKQLLSYKADVNIANYFGKTPLHIAAEQGDISMLEILLEAGANIHTQDKDLRTPFITAVAQEEDELVSLLISKGARIDVQSKGGWQALHFAATHGNQKVMKMLLDKGADPAATLWRGDTVAQLIQKENKSFSEKKLKSLLQLLKSDSKDSSKIISKGDTKSSTKKATLSNYQTALHTAIQVQDIQKISQLLKETSNNINKPDLYGRTALEKAIFSSNINSDLAKKSMRLLLKAGADVNMLNRHKESPLLLAVRENIQPDIIKLLLENGAKPNLADYLSNTPLLEASKQAKVEIIKQLITAGAKIDQQTYNKKNVVQLALSGSVEKTAQRLLATSGQSWKNLSAEEQEKALHIAHEQHNEIALFLFKSLPTIRSKNVKEYIASILDTAMQKKYNQLARYLLKQYPLPESDILKWLKFSIDNKNLAMSELLYQQIPASNKHQILLTQEGWLLTTSLINAGDEFSPLLKQLLIAGAGKHLAEEDKATQIMNSIIETEQVKIAQVILDSAKSDSDLDIFNPKTSWLLIDSASQGKLSMVQLFLERGFTLENQNEQAETALLVATAFGHTEVVQLLLEKGANPNIQNKYGQAPLDVINKNNLKIKKAGDVSNGLLIARLLIKHGAQFKNTKFALDRALDLADFDLVSYFIKQFKVDINQNLNDGNSFILAKLLTELTTSSISDNENQQKGLALLNYLFAHHVDVNKLNSLTNQYPLDLVFSKPELLKLLLKHGANPKAIDTQGRGHIQKLVMDSGAIEDLVESLNLLSSAQAPFDHQDKKGDTPLHVLLRHSEYGKAGAKNQRILLNLLLEEAKKQDYASLAILNKQQETPFSLIFKHIDNGYMQKTVLTVLSHYQQIKNQAGVQKLQSPLLKVCRQPIFIEELLNKQGVDVNSTNKEGENCLHSLLERTEALGEQGEIENELAAMQLLIEKNIQINQQSKTGETALFKLATSQYKFNYFADYNQQLYKQKIDLLLKQKPDLTLARNKDSATPLHVVTNPTLLKTMLEKLLENNSQLDIQDYKGNTPLHLATNKKLVDILLTKGANPNIQNTKGETPLFNAVRKNDKATIDLLLSNKANLDVINSNGDSLLHLTSDLSLIKKLIANGANVKRANKQGVTPLHQSSTPVIADLLLKQGANINAQDINAQTALHYAVITNKQAMFDWLINHNANIGIIDKFGETALFKTAYTNNFKIFKTLVSKGAKPVLTNKLGDNPLHIALAKHSYQVADYLIKLLPKNNITNQNWEGKTALAFAIENSHYGFANLLEELGATQPEWPVNLIEQQKNPFWLQRALQQNLPTVAAKLLVPKKAVSQVEITRRARLRAFGSNQTTLQMAAKLGEISLFKPLIQYGNALDTVNSKSQTALMIAIKNNRIQAAQELLELGANPLIRDLDNNTILHMAVKSGNPQFLTIIINMIKEKRITGLDINAVNSHGQSILQLAAELNNLPMVKLLLNNKADPNTVDKQSMSALLFAAKHADEKIIKLLIENNANLKQRNNVARTPLLVMLQKYVDKHRQHFDAKENKRIIGIMEYMLDHGADLEAAGKDKRGALLIAISNHDIASALLKRGVNIHVQDDEQNTPLLQSVKIKYPQPDPVSISRKLLEMGADIEHANQWKESALHIAIRSNNFPAISLLIDSGAKLNVYNDGGYTPLHNVVETTRLNSAEKIQLTKQLIAHKADLNKRNPIDNVALNIALSYDHNEIALLLVNAGADVNIPNYSGNAAIHILASRLANDKQAWIKINRQLFQAIKDHKANLKQRNESGNSPLQLAIISNNQLLASLLIKEASVISKINELNFNGKSALHIAVEHNNKKVIAQLIKAGVNLNQKDNRGSTALHYAALDSQKHEIIQMLIAAGAKVNIKNYDRETPLDLATQHNNEIAIKLITLRIQALKKELTLQ